MATQITFEQSAKLYVGKKGIPGDLWNNMAAVQFHVHNPKEYSKIAHLKTYAEYLRDEKFDWSRELAEAVLAVSDTAAVAQYDSIIAKINETIGDGVKSASQADALVVLLDDMRELIYGRRQTPRL